MASSSTEDKEIASSSVLTLFRNAWDEVKSKNPSAGDGYVEILNRFGERKEYTALDFWVLILQEFEDHSANINVETPIKKETPIFTNNISYQITNTYFENLNLGKDHWLLVQDFPLRNNVLDVLRHNLETEQNNKNTDLYLKLIKALENSSSKNITPNKLLKNDDEKKKTIKSSPKLSKNTTNKNQNFSRNNRQTRYARPNPIRPQGQSVPVEMPVIQSIPYNSQMPVPSLYPYGPMYCPMSASMRLPFPTPMPAMYPLPPTVPIPMSVPLPLQTPYAPNYMPGYVRYPPSIVYSQIIPPPPPVEYQVEIPMDIAYNSTLNQYPQANVQECQDNQYDNQNLSGEDQTIVYFQNEKFNYYSDDDDYDSEYDGSYSSGSEYSESNDCNNEISAEVIQNNESTQDKQEPHDIIEISVIQDQTGTMREESSSSNDKSAKQLSTVSITIESQSTSSSNEKVVLTQKTSAPEFVINNKLLNLPLTSKSANNTSIQAKNNEAVTKKSVHFADNLPKLNNNITKDTYDERMYLRTPTIFEILESRKDLDPEEAERPPTCYMEDVIQRKERRWKQMDKVPGSPSLEIILEMIKQDMEMIEREEQEQKEAQLKLEEEKKNKIFELKSTDAQLEVNIQARHASTNIKVTTETADECDQTEIVYEPLKLQEPVIVQPIPESEEGKNAEKKIKAAETIGHLITEKDVVIDDEDRELLNRLDNSNSGFKEVWISDSTVTEMKDQLFDKWCKTKPKSTTNTTICSQEQHDQQLDVDLEQHTSDGNTPTDSSENDTSSEEKIYVAKDESTQTNISKPIRPIVRKHRYTQTVEQVEPEVKTYASVLRTPKK